jgi:hypothetical protein
MYYVIFEVFTPVTEDAVSFNMMPCCSCKIRRFGETYRLNLQVRKISALGAKLAVTSSLIVVAMMMEAIFSFETYFLRRSTLRHVRQNGILHDSKISVCQALRSKKLQI